MLVLEQVSGLSTLGRIILELKLPVCSLFLHLQFSVLTSAKGVDLSLIQPSWFVTHGFQVLCSELT